MNNDQAKAIVEKAWGAEAAQWDVCVRTHGDDRHIEIECDGAPEVTFAQLAALSEAFETRAINLGGESYGYCETCAGYITTITVDIHGFGGPTVDVTLTPPVE